MLLTLLTAADAASGAPSSLTATTGGQALGVACDQVTILVHSTAGSGTMTVKVAVWAWYPEASRWYRCGLLNEGSAIAETGSDGINYCEAVVGLRGATHIFAEVTEIAGTATAVTVAAKPIPSGAFSG
jgi:hypothetical protein